MEVMPKKSQGSIVFAIIAFIFFIYLYIQILSFNQGEITNPIIGGMYFILFGVHEAAHIVLMFASPVVTAAAGSLTEIVFVSLLLWVSIRAKSYLATGFSLIWFMLALSSAGRYMADAKDLLIPLIGPGANPQHDWNFVFTELNLLEQSGAIGDAIRFGGYAIGIAGLIVTLTYILKLVISR